MKKKDYLLMNKDKLVEKVELPGICADVCGKRPYGYSNIWEWIRKRKQMYCVRNAKQFLRELGLESTEQFIEQTHLVSLSDSFWVKSDDSSLTWSDVSPFRNNYSKRIGTYALEGFDIGETGEKTYSPVIGTSGSFPHTWKIEDGRIKFIKAGSKYTLGGGNSGREPFSEYYAYIISKFLGFKCVAYELAEHTRHDGRVDIVTKCDCYTTEQVGAVSAYELGLSSYESVLGYCSSHSKESLSSALDMLFLDSLLMNTDRHFGNIEFLVDNDSLKVLGLAPICDNNRSMLPMYIEGYDNLSETIEELYAYDGKTFDELYRLVLKYRSYKTELFKLRELRLLAPETVGIKEERLKFLNNFLQLRVEHLLSLEG